MILRDEHTAAVQRMLAYIDTHLDQVVTLRNLADAAWFSPWYSARLFKEATGVAPFTYLRHRRLSEAARKLQSQRVKIVDVAFDFVFDSHEGFTRAFTRQFGMSPLEYRHHVTRVFRSKPSKSQTKMATLHEGEKMMETVFVQVVDRPARRAVVRFAQKAIHYFEYCTEVGCDTWDTLGAIKDALYEPVGMWMPLNMRRQGTGEYLQGVEVPLDWALEVPTGFDLIDLPPCKMMIFQGPPFEEEDFEQAISDVWELMKRYDPKLYGFEWADADGPRFQLSPMGWRGYIEGRPVRTLQ